MAALPYPILFSIFSWSVLDRRCERGVIEASKERRLRMARITRLMHEVEVRHGKPLERLLVDMVNEFGLAGTAARLQTATGTGVSKATLGYWLLKLGINVRRIALAPDETITIKIRRV